jgi:hypothetical protein
VTINVDASYSEDEGLGSLGSIVRYYTCKFTASQNEDLPFVDDAMTDEAYALREGLCLAQSWGALDLLSNRIT